MSYKYMLLDSRGAPVAQGVSEDGPEKNVWHRCSMLQAGSIHFLLQ